MDVKGPADSHDFGSNVSPRRRELLRKELAEASPKNSYASRYAEDATPEVHHLTRQLRAIPEVRTEAIAVAREKLLGEYFSTRASAERTAEAILQTLTKD